jgi:hypothetical protein
MKTEYIVFYVKSTNMWELHEKDTGKDADLFTKDGGSKIAECKLQTPLIVACRLLEKNHA